MFEMQGGTVSQDAIFALLSACFLNYLPFGGTTIPLRENQSKIAPYGALKPKALRDILQGLVLLLPKSMSSAKLNFHRFNELGSLKTNVSSVL